MRDTCKKENEIEQAFKTSLSKAAALCGNFHSSDEKMTMFVDGLDKSIKTLVARYRDKSEAQIT